MNSIKYSISILLLIIAITGLSHSAYAQIACVVEQITFEQEEDSEQNAISADGTTIAFQSSGDLTGQNPNFVDQIFLYDIFTESFSQVTFFNSGDAAQPSLSGNAELLAFSSNANGNREIFLHNTTTTTTTQVTNDPPNDSDGASLATTGANLAFQSDPGGPNNLFQFIINGGVINQLTNLTASINNPSSNGNGNLIAFSAFSNVTGQNPDGNQELFLFNVNANSIKQVTMGQAGVNSRNGRFALDATGELITFTANGDPSGTGGQFPNGNQQIFLYDGTQNSFTQITKDQLFGPEDSAINENGTCVVFVSRENHTGENPENDRELFLYDIANGTYTQLGNNLTDGSISTPTPNADCTTIAFNSRGDYGRNPQENRQLYLARCLDGPRPIPTLSEWGLIAMAGVLGLVGLLAIRRRKLAA